MCRMLIAVGKIDISQLIDDFLIMASDQNEKHENNDDKEFKHCHGWGISYMKDGVFTLEKSALPCYEDESINHYKNIDTPIVILHARRASKGRGGPETVNAHPFQYGDYIFCHNGGVNEDLRFENQFHLKGKTDSEQLFYYLISNMNNSLNATYVQQKLLNITDYSGMNLFLSNGEISYIANWYRNKPVYYTMKLLDDNDKLILSSEILPHYKEKKWRYLKNKDIVKIVTSTKEFSILSL